MRTIKEIAAEIKADWKNWRNSYAAEYLNAMSSLETINDNYYFDSADSIVRYFLSNAQGWRGDTAKRVKRELKDMVGIK